MMKRILTILIEIEEKEKTHWIWDNHLLGTVCNGIRVLTICEGDQIKDITEQDEE